MTARLPASLFPVAPFAAALLGALVACTPQNGAGDAGTEAEGDTTVAARIGDEAITMAELDAWVKEELFRRQTGEGDPAKLHEVRSEALQNLVNRRVIDAEAEARGVTPEELMSTETEERSQVSDDEVRGFYERHKDRITAEFDAVELQIRQHLAQQKQSQAASELVASLREKYGAEILLEAPRIEVAADGPARGPEDAPVTIVEFSDYECPYCRRAEPTVDQILERYPDQVRLVYRHFPLDNIHPRARPAALAAVCADAQGRFWEFHDLLFASEDLEDETLARYAEQVGLDEAAFEECLQASETKRKVATDLEAGREAGVTGTPVFFVNGVPIRGARPFQDFVELIERELDGGAAEASAS